MFKWLKWFSVFYRQRREIVLEQWNNRHTITTQMSKKDKLIHHTETSGAGFSFNETQKQIKNETNKRFNIKSNVDTDDVLPERICQSFTNIN